MKSDFLDYVIYKIILSIPIRQETEAEVDEYVICDNEYLRATFLGIGDSFGYVTLDVKLENKTDGEITVIPMDSSVDDVMVQFLSGLPATMQGHKSMNQAWLIGSEPQNNIEFKLWIVDENWSDLYKTETIRLVRQKNALSQGISPGR